MDGSLPTSLKHIISNAEYYGPSLFLLGKSNIVVEKKTPFKHSPHRFNKILIHFFLFHSHRSRDGVCVPGAITALLLAR